MKNSNNSSASQLEHVFFCSSGFFKDHILSYLSDTSLQLLYCFQKMNKNIFSAPYKTTLPWITPFFSCIHVSLLFLIISSVFLKYLLIKCVIIILLESCCNISLYFLVWLAVAKSIFLVPIHSPNKVGGKSHVQNILLNKLSYRQRWQNRMSMAQVCWAEWGVRTLLYLST